MIKRIGLFWAFLVCPNGRPNRPSVVKLEALFKNKLSKKRPNLKYIGNSKNLKSMGFSKLPNRVIWAKKA